ncbi:MAG: hypothetical protein GY928_21365 [Colwellia sp.]|nr:hypothetical protein [Colwellia sp.]
MVIKQRSIFLYIGYFFLLIIAINTTDRIMHCDIVGMKELLVINSILAIPFFVLYKLNPIKIKLDIVIAIMYILWALSEMLIFKEKLIDYSIMMVYGFMLILKNLELKLKSILMLGAGLFALSMISLMVADVTIVDTAKNFLLITMLSILHYYFYDNSYKEKPDIKKKYRLTDQEFKLINIFLDLCQTDPSNKAIAEKMFISESHIKALLNSIYEKFDIQKGGNKKTVLIFKLRDF